MNDDASTWEKICHSTLICDTCRREVDYVRGSMWHGTSRICRECFIMWYDGDEGVDPTDPVSIGNAVRRKHGLPELGEILI